MALRINYESPPTDMFFTKIKQDNHITAGYISQFMALFELWNQNRFNSPVLFYRKEIMTMAKMIGTVAYHKCIKDLQSLGYIEYYPSHNPAVPSEVYFLWD